MAKTNEFEIYIKLATTNTAGRRRRAEYDDGVPRVVIPSPSPNKQIN